jgi:sirohydrochlorin cobaltochelatase
MKTMIVLAMHGAPPKDFPRPELIELMGLHSRLEHVRGPEREPMQRRHDELDAKMRDWPRTPENDPFWAASQNLAHHLSQVTGCEVVVGFNEFCGPDMDAALERVVDQGANKVVVVTPMMTRGGEHSEVEIPAIVQNAQERHPDVSFTYVWPFDTGRVAQFLAEQIEHHERRA